MPAMNGYELVTKMKQINPDIKICLISAFEDKLTSNLIFLTLSRLMNSYKNPLSIGKLTEIIGDMLEIYNK